MKKYKAINIVWDTTDNGEELVNIPSLPNEVEIPEQIDDINMIADYLSDKYGWLVKSLDVIKK